MEHRWNNCNQGIKIHRLQSLANGVKWGIILELLTRFELVTSSLPNKILVAQQRKYAILFVIICPYLKTVAIKLLSFFHF